MKIIPKYVFCSQLMQLDEKGIARFMHAWRKKEIAKILRTRQVDQSLPVPSTGRMFVGVTPQRAQVMKYFGAGNWGGIIGYEHIGTQRSTWNAVLSQLVRLGYIERTGQEMRRPGKKAIPEYRLTKAGKRELNAYEQERQAQKPKKMADTGAGSGKKNARAAAHG